MRIVLVVMLMLAAGNVVAQSMFRGNAAHTGVYASEAPRQAPSVKWSFPTGDRIVSSPVWHGGVLYFGSDDGHVYAVDAATGVQRWKYRTGGPVPGSAAVADGRVYIGSYDSRFYALDAATGAVRWTFVSGGERRFEARGLHGMMPKHQTIADPFDVYLSSPVLALGMVFFGSGDGHLYALDAASGEQRWKFKTGDVVHGSPAYHDGVLYVGSWDSRLYAVDARSGRELWRFQAGQDPLIHNQVGFQSSPAVVDGVVYVGGRDSKLWAIDARTGQEKWHFATGASWVITSPAVHRGRVIFATSDSSLVHMLDATTGKPLVQQQGDAFMFASPAVAGDVVLFGVLNGTLEARDLTSGELLWRWQTEASRANRGWVLTVDRRFNTPMIFTSNWREGPAVGTERQFSVGSVFSSPLVVAGVIYVGSADGRLYALE